MHEIVFLFDVDNTLLDNDTIQADLRRHLTEEYGEAARDRYWALFEELRTQLGYTDYLGTLERYRLEDIHDPRVLGMANWMIDYPFHERLYPFAIEALKRAKGWGPAVILSDGDAVFQPRKVQRSGIWDIADEVLIYVHKEEELDDVRRLFPSRHYVLIDDKLRILDAVKRLWGSDVTTVMPRQGQYAHDPKVLSGYPAADVQLETIGDFLKWDPQDFRSA